MHLLPLFAPDGDAPAALFLAGGALLSSTLLSLLLHKQGHKCIREASSLSFFLSSKESAQELMSVHRGPGAAKGPGVKMQTEKTNNIFLL